jgi:hypothetical protein
MTKDRQVDPGKEEVVMAGAGVGSGQDHDALRAARSELDATAAAKEPRLASSMQNAEPDPDVDEDTPTILVSLGETSDLTRVGDAMAMSTAEDAELMDGLADVDL